MSIIVFPTLPISWNWTLIGHDIFCTHTPINTLAAINVPSVFFVGALDQPKETFLKNSSRRNKQSRWCKPVELIVFTLLVKVEGNQSIDQGPSSIQGI